jgi:WD40 repeat protein
MNGLRAVASLVAAALSLSACARPPGPAAWVMPEAHSERVMALSWAPDGEHLASASFDGTVRVWEVATRREVRRLTLPSPYVLDVSWSPSGDRLAVTTNDAIHLFDAENAERVATIQTTIGALEPPRWQPDGTYLALASAEGSVRLFDGSGTEQRALQGHSKGVSSLAWSRDGRLLASGAWDNSVRVWDVDRRVQVHTLTDLPTASLEVAWSPEGGMIGIHGAVQKDARVWDVAANEVRVLPTAAGVTRIAWRWRGRVVAIGLQDGTVALWDPTTTRAERAVRCGRFVDDLAWSADGERLAIVSFMESAVCLWDAVAPAPHEAHVDHGPILAIAWSPARPSLACAGADGQVRVWDIVGDHSHSHAVPDALASGPGASQAAGRPAARPRPMLGAK